jgi:signal transduction histidine kinase
MSQVVRRRTLNTYSLLLIVPVLLAGVNWWGAYQHRLSIAAVAHTKDVLASIDRVMIAVLSAESSQRGFLLTKQDPYFHNYQRRREDANAYLREMDHLISDNGVQRKNWEALSSAVSERFSRLDTTLESFRQNPSLRDQMTSELAEGTRMMRRIRAAINVMTIEENRLMAHRAETQKKTELFVAFSFAAGFLANMALLYWAYQLLRAYAKRRDSADLEIRTLNAELERRVTERTSELQAANLHLSRSNDDLTRFAYIASHDLQEPLRTIGSYAGLLGRRYDSQLDEQARRYIGFMIDGAKRMQTLVQDLLAYSRAGTQPLHCTSTELSGVVKQAIENLQASISEKNATVTIANLPSITIDPMKMTLVFQNLIGNALKFGRDNVPVAIHVTATRANNAAVVTVQDNGIGFEGEYADKIFVVFQRLHSLGTYPGNGIGLAICKRIVEAHGGKIWANSKPNQGSTFFVSLPLLETDPPKPESQEPELSSKRGSNQ